MTATTGTAFPGAGTLKLGLSIGYWQTGPAPDLFDKVTLADELGYDSVWTAEAYGADALMPLAWLGALTQNIGLGSGIVQMSARTPTATAMAAMTLDQLSGGRVKLGIGASGPQVVEGWYGQEFGKPLARTREYVAILRQIFARERLEFHGTYYDIPLQGGTGLGKALRSTLHPQRPTIPILIAAQGPKNVALAAEIADGWIPGFYSPYDDTHYRAALEEGFAKRETPGWPDHFEIPTMTDVVIDDDVERAADQVRPRVALYVGGMGARGVNFHHEAIARIGFEAECAHIQDLYLAGRKDEAIAAVPLRMIEKMALVGPKEKIRDDLEAWKASPITTLLINGTPEVLRFMAEAVA